MKRLALAIALAIAIVCRGSASQYYAKPVCFNQMGVLTGGKSGSETKFLPRLD
jgi:hypothetical protein